MEEEEWRLLENEQVERRIIEREGLGLVQERFKKTIIKEQLFKIVFKTSSMIFSKIKSMFGNLEYSQLVFYFFEIFLKNNFYL